MSSLHDFLHNGKGGERPGFVFFGHDTLLVLLVILVATASFGLGRLSYKETINAEVMVGEIELETMPASAYASKEKQKEQGVSVVGNTEETGAVVASKNGTKYHFPWCSGAQRISPENLIYFNSIEEARTAGYSPASNCKGLH